ncbi:MAG: hypothetical protein KIT22_20290, partial [Verrucomicrobiae bacterium]|nr:hypothetical protein [Verrucomicrobiae bacterium]
MIERVLDHVDGWLGWTTWGAIHAGLWSHSVAPPVWTAATTIDYHDLVEPAVLDPSDWQDTTNVTVVQYSDRTRSYKTRPARVENGWNRQATGVSRIRTVERPYILRTAQAMLVATEDAKLSAQPYHEGSLVVRAEKAEAIEPGTLFRLTHDAVGLSIACRCVGKIIGAPPSGNVTIRYQTERGISALPYVATTPQGITDPPPAPSRLLAVEILQIPPSLGDGSDYNLLSLAARADALTSRYGLWVRAEDATDFYQLVTVPNFAVAGVVDGALGPFTDGVVDDDGESVRIVLAAGTPAPDLDRVDEVQTADTIEDNAYLLFLVRASAPAQFEIMTIKSATLVSALTYDLVVRRARYGTLQGGDGAYTWDDGD